jgi:AcrR family transcriptional regulator
MPKVSDTYRADRRHAILEAAVACFDRRGLHATTTDDIAAEAGLSAGALYRYFDGKEAIVEAIAAERHARELELLLAASAVEDPRAGIAGFVDDYFAWISTPDERRRRRVNVHVWAEALANPRVAAIVREGIAPTADAARLVEGAVASGALPAHVEPQGFVHVVLALLQGFMLQAAWDPELDVEAFRATVLAMIEAHLAPVDAR